VTLTSSAPAANTVPSQMARFRGAVGSTMLVTACQLLALDEVTLETVTVWVSTDTRSRSPGDPPGMCRLVIPGAAALSSIGYPPTSLIVGVTTALADVAISATPGSAIAAASTAPSGRANRRRARIGWDVERAIARDDATANSPLVVIERCSESGHYLPELRDVGEPKNFSAEARRLESQRICGPERISLLRPVS